MSLSAFGPTGSSGSPGRAPVRPGNAFLDPARRKGPWVAAFLAVVIALAGVAAGAAFTRRTPATTAGTATTAGGGSGSSTLPPAPGTSGSASDTASGSGSGTAAGGSVLHLVAGRDVVNGVAVGYPRSAVGAVSAGAEYLTQIGTFDPDREAAVGRVIAESAWSDVAEEFGQAAQTSRKDYGLPPTGPLPSGSSLQVSPQQYQILDSHVAGQMTVLFLSYLVVTTQQQGTTSTVIIEPAALRWENHDWKLMRSTDNGQSALRPLLAVPFTAQATSRGWHTMQS